MPVMSGTNDMPLLSCMHAWTPIILVVAVSGLRVIIRAAGCRCPTKLSW